LVCQEVPEDGFDIRVPQPGMVPPTKTNGHGINKWGEYLRGGGPHGVVDTQVLARFSKLIPHHLGCKRGNTQCLGIKGGCRGGCTSGTKKTNGPTTEATPLHKKKNNIRKVGKQLRDQKPFKAWKSKQAENPRGTSGGKN